MGHGNQFSAGATVDYANVNFYFGHPGRCDQLPADRAALEPDRGYTRGFGRRPGVRCDACESALPDQGLRLLPDRYVRRHLRTVADGQRPLQRVRYRSGRSAGHQPDRQQPLRAFQPGRRRHLQGVAGPDGLRGCLAEHPHPDRQRNRVLQSAAAVFAALEPGGRPADAAGRSWRAPTRSAPAAAMRSRAAPGRGTRASSARCCTTTSTASPRPSARASSRTSATRAARVSSWVSSTEARAGPPSPTTATWMPPSSPRWCCPRLQARTRTPPETSRWRRATTCRAFRGIG